MSSIALLSRNLNDFMRAASTRALDAALVYDGEVPERPRDVYQMATRSVRISYVYIFMRDDRAIYVGMSVNPGARYERHSPRSWFPVANRYVLIRLDGATAYEAEQMARFLEAKAMRAFCPSHNIAGMS